MDSVYEKIIELYKEIVKLNDLCCDFSINYTPEITTITIQKYAINLNGQKFVIDNEIAKITETIVVKTKEIEKLKQYKCCKLKGVI